MAEGESFTRKILRVDITMRAGDFGGHGNQKSIQGLATRAKIEKTGPPDYSKAQVEICNLPYEDMEQLTTLAFKPMASAKNLIEILAGTEEDDLSVAFRGEITAASADFSGGIGDVWMKFDAIDGYYGAITAQGPSAIQGSQPASQFIEQQAKAMGYGFRNLGVETSLLNAIFNGSPIEQARSAARQIGAELYLDDGVLTLSPVGGVQEEGNAVFLSAETGLLGYPKITNEGVELEALYNPAFKLGSFIELESVVPKCSGVWRIIKLSHELNAFCKDGGKWMSKIVGFLPDEEPKNNVVQGTVTKIKI